MALRFRPLERCDFPLLSQWLARPHVETWWREAHDLTAVEARYGPCVDGTDPTEVFVVECDGRPLGMIQRYRIDDNPDWERTLAPTGVLPEAPTAGIDYLIGDETMIGRGLGVDMIDRFVEETWRRYQDVTAILVDVLQANRRSWRALEKAGFERGWAGILDSDDPSDEGPAYVYVRERSTRT